MDQVKKIDTQKTEKTSVDTDKYGDAMDVDYHHYLGNDENIPRETKKENDKKIGQEALGNIEYQEERDSP